MGAAEAKIVSDLGTEVINLDYGPVTPGWAAESRSTFATLRPSTAPSTRSAGPSTHCSCRPESRTFLT